MKYQLFVWSRTNDTERGIHYYKTEEEAIKAKAICALDDLDTKLCVFINAHVGYVPMKGE